MCAEITGIMDFCNVYKLHLSVIDTIVPESISCISIGRLEWVAFGLAGLTIAFVVINSLLLVFSLYTWFERRAIGRFQARLGPNRWGPFGILQPIADAIKFFTKEDVVPLVADRHLFNIAPIVMAAPAITIFFIIPFGATSFLGMLNIGVLFILGITSVNTIGILMAGWASRNKYAVIGTMRGVAMLVSYEVPMALALTGVVMLAGSMSLVDIVVAQNVPFIFVQPLGFLVFIAAASAEMSRTPFDMIESESELIGGYHTEYTGMKFAVLQMAEFMAPLVTAVVTTTLFLGGTRGFEPIPGTIWFLLKSFMVVFVLLWIRSTWPRLRVDQIMGFAWKALFPLAIINMFLIAFETQLLRDPVSNNLETIDLWIMGVINWSVTALAIVIMANILGQPRLKRATPVPSPLANMYSEAE